MGIVGLDVQRDMVDPEALEVWVDGFVGEQPVRFRLDTGARRCSIGPSEATRDLVSTGRDPGVGASGTGLDEDEIAIPRLRVGDVGMTDVAATRALDEVDVSPLLGMSALGRFRCHFRFSTGHLELGGADLPACPDWFDLIVAADGQPMVPVCFDDVEVLTFWDTGAGLTAVDTEFARAHPQLFEPVRDAIGVDSAGVEMPTQIAQMPECRIGSIQFAPSACALVDLTALNTVRRRRALEEGRLIEPVSFILGLPAITQADWTFDFPARRWTVTQPQPG